MKPVVALVLLLLASSLPAHGRTVHVAERLPDPAPGVEAWRLPDVGQAIACFAQIGEHLWLGGEGGLLMHSRDGVEWTRVPTNDSAAYRSLTFRPRDRLVVVERFVPDQAKEAMRTFRVNPDGSPFEPLGFASNHDREQPERTVSHVERIGEMFWGRQISPADVYVSEDGLRWQRSNFVEIAPTRIDHPRRVVMADAMAYLMADRGAVYAAQDARTWRVEIPGRTGVLFTEHHAAVFGRRILLAFGSRWGGSVHLRTDDAPWVAADPFEGRTVLGIAQRRGWALVHARETRKSGPGQFDPWEWRRPAFFLGDDGEDWTELAAPSDANFRVDATDSGFFIGAPGGRFYRVSMPAEPAAFRAGEERLAFSSVPTPLRLRGLSGLPIDVDEAVRLVRAATDGDADARRRLLDEVDDPEGRFHRNPGVLDALLAGMGDDPEALYRRALLGVETGRLAGAAFADALDRAYRAGSARAGLDLAAVLLDGSGGPADPVRAAAIYEEIALRTDELGARAKLGLGRARVEVAMNSTDETVLRDAALRVVEDRDAAAAIRLVARMAPRMDGAGPETRRAFVALGRIPGVAPDRLDASVREALVRARIALAREANDVAVVRDGVEAARDRDDAAYRELLERAAGLGDPAAMMALGDDHLGGWRGFPRDPQAAEAWYRRAGAAGDPRGARIALVRDHLGRPLPGRDGPLTDADPEMLELLRALASGSGPLSDEDFGRLVRAAWKDGRYAEAGERVGIALVDRRGLLVDAGGEAFTFQRTFRDNRIVSAMLPGPLLDPQPETLFQVAEQTGTIGPIVFVLECSDGDAEQGRILLARSLGRAMTTAKQEGRPALVTELLEAFRGLARGASPAAAETVRQGLLAAVEIVREHDATLVDDATIAVLGDPAAWTGGGP